MRIAQFIQTIDATAGGTSTAFLGTLAALRTRAELSVQAFCARPADGDPAWPVVNAAPARFTLAPYGRSIRPGPLGRAVVDAARARSFDLLHMHGLWSPDLLAAGAACRRAGIPYVWEPHGMLVREAYNQKRLKKEVFMAMGLRATLKAAAAMVFVTPEERDHSLIPAGYPRERLHAIPLPVEPPTFPIDAAFRAAARTRFGARPGEPVVVFLGRLHPVKRVEIAIRALATITPEQRPRLILVGGGEEAYERTLRELAAALNVAEWCVFSGWVRGDDKWAALAAGDVLTLNSLHENFGYVAVEALCVGSVPVLTRNLAIAGELHEAGLAEISEPQPADLGKAWQRAIARARQQPEAVLNRGRAWVDEHLAPSAIGVRLAGLYQGIARPH